MSVLKRVDSELLGARRPRALYSFSFIHWRNKGETGERVRRKKRKIDDLGGV